MDELLEEDETPQETDTSSDKYVTGPAYIVVRNGEVALVSESTGEFQITDGDRDTFRFLFDALGEESFVVAEE